MWVLTAFAVAGALCCPGSGGAGMDFGRVAPLTGEAATDGTADDMFPSLTTDGHGNWIAAWNESQGGTLGITGGAAPVFSRSLDDGATWSGLALVRPETASDNAADPDVATDTNGRWILVWGTTGQELRATISDDNGQTWGSPTVLISSAFPAIDIQARIATDRAGTWVVAWRSSDNLGGTIGNDGDILFSRSTDNGLGWSVPAPLNTNAATDAPYNLDTGVRIATDRAGTWVAVWSIYADAWYARSTDNGATWSAPAVLSHVGLDRKSVV